MRSQKVVSANSPSLRQILSDFDRLVSDPGVEPLILSIAIAAWMEIHSGFKNALKKRGAEVFDDGTVVLNGCRIRPPLRH